MRNFIKLNIEAFSKTDEFIDENFNDIEKIYISFALNDRLKKCSLFGWNGKNYTYKRIKILRDSTIRYNRFYFITKEGRLDFLNFLGEKDNGKFIVDELKL